MNSVASTLVGTTDEIVYVGDPRIKEGLRDRIDFYSEKNPYPIRDPHEHHEPRMWGVHSLPHNWWMWPGEWAEVEAPEEIGMLGVVIELACHHPRARLYVNGVNMTPDQLDGFCPGLVDGLGCIKWFMLPRGKKTVRLQIMDDYCPVMHESERVRKAGFCLAGFIFKQSFELPPPVYATTSWTESMLNDTLIPPSVDGRTPGLLEIGDLPHPGEIQFLRIAVDNPNVEIWMTDGMGAAPENRIWLSSLCEFKEEWGLNGQALPGVGAVLEWSQGRYNVAFTLPLPYMRRFRLHLRNPTREPAHLLSMRCVAKVRLC